MRPRAILFDVDDTLIVETPVVEASFLAACEEAREFGLDPAALATAARSHAERLWLRAPETELCRSIGMSSWESLWAEFGGDDPDERRLRAWAPAWRREAWSAALAEQGARDGAALADRLSAAFRRERQSRNVLFPEVEEVLRHFRGTHRLGLVSNGVASHQLSKVRSAGVLDHFDAAVFSGDVKAGKPDRRVFEAALRALGVRPDEAAMVGNSLRRDVAGALGAGLLAVWVNRAGAVATGGIVPDAVVTDLRQLREVLPE